MVFAQSYYYFISPDAYCQADFSTVSGKDERDFVRLNL